MQLRRSSRWKHVRDHNYLLSKRVSFRIRLQLSATHFFLTRRVALYFYFQRQKEQHQTHDDRSAHFRAACIHSAEGIRAVVAEEAVAQAINANPAKKLFAQAHAEPCNSERTAHGATADGRSEGHSFPAQAPEEPGADDNRAPFSGRRAEQEKQGTASKVRQTPDTSLGCKTRPVAVETPRLQAGQISGAPDWLNVDKYDIEAKATGLDQSVIDEVNNLSDDLRQQASQFQSNLQAILADRSRLTFHRETKRGSTVRAGHFGEWS